MKNVKAILIDAKNKVVKFDGNLFSIYELIGEEVECIDYSELGNGDIIHYELQSEESNCEDWVEFGNSFIRGNILITGNVTDDTNQFVCKYKNCKSHPLLFNNEIEFHHESELTFG